MKNKRNIIIFIILLFTLIVIPKNVEAEVDSQGRVRVCGYKVTYKRHKRNDNSYTDKYDEYAFSEYVNIYYYPKQEGIWQFTWGEYDNKNQRWSKKGTVDQITSSDYGENIYMQQKLSNSSFRCPTYAYIDMYRYLGAFDGERELCFGTKEYCLSKENSGTNFLSHDMYTSDTLKNLGSNKTYDLDVEIKKYITENLNFDDVDCSQFKSSMLDQNAAETLANQISNEIKTKYFGGSDTPSFIQNGQSMSLLQNNQSYLQEIIDNKKSSCAVEYYNAKQANQITEEEYKQLNNELNDVNSEEIATQMQNNFITTLRSNEINIDNLNQEIDCEGIFNFNEGHFGWLLQKILDYIKIIGPILVVILSALDFVKAVFSSDDKAMKQAQSKLVIRLCAAIALFLVPTIVSLLLQLINGISDPTCGFH